MDFTPVTFHLKDGRTAVLSAPTAAFPSAGSSGGWASARPCFGN